MQYAIPNSSHYLVLRWWCRKLWFPSNSVNPRYRFFSVSKWHLKNIKMQLSQRQVTLRFCLLVWFIWKYCLIHELKYRREWALDFCLEEQTIVFYDVKGKNSSGCVHMHVSQSHYNFLSSCLLCSWNMYFSRFSYGNWQVRSSWWQFASFLYFLLYVYHLKNK